jgi:hypothetical protein
MSKLNPTNSVEMAGYIARIETEQERIFARLQAEIDKARGINPESPNIAMLEAKLASAKEATKNSLDRLNSKLEEFKQAEKVVDDRQHEQMSQTVARLSAQRKALALSEWTKIGGDPDQFEEAWPEIEKAALVNKTVSKVSGDLPKDKSNIGISL